MAAYVTMNGTQRKRNVTDSMTSDRIMEMSKCGRGGGCVHHDEQDAEEKEHARLYVLASQACSL